MSVELQEMPKMRVDTHFVGRLASMTKVLKFRKEVCLHRVTLTLLSSGHKKGLIDNFKSSLHCATAIHGLSSWAF